MSQNQWNKPAIISYQEEKRSLSSNSNLFGFAILRKLYSQIKVSIIQKERQTLIPNTPSSLQIR